MSTDQYTTKEFEVLDTKLVHVPNDFEAYLANLREEILLGFTEEEIGVSLGEMLKNAVEDLRNSSLVWLGKHATAPTESSEGVPLDTASLYYNTVSNDLFLYNGTTWVSLTAGSGTKTSLNYGGLYAYFFRALRLDRSKFSHDSWEVLEAVLIDGENLLENGAETQDDIDAALAAIQGAIAALQPKVNTDVLVEARIQAILALMEAEYTAQSWAVFVAAMTHAHETATSESVTQSDVDSALAALENAVVNLVAWGPLLDRLYQSIQTTYETITEAIAENSFENEPESPSEEPLVFSYTKVIFTGNLPHFEVPAIGYLFATDLAIEPDHRIIVDGIDDGTFYTLYWSLGALHIEIDQIYGITEVELQIDSGPVLRVPMGASNWGSAGAIQGVEISPFEVGGQYTVRFNLYGELYGEDGPIIEPDPDPNDPQPEEPFAPLQLTSSDALSGQFGAGVALDGTRLAVGATQAAADGVTAGKVYIYDRNGTTYDEVATVTASDAEDNDYFGSSVALDGTRLVVGAIYESTASEHAGKIYVYEWNGTSYDEVSTLTASDAESGDHFGKSVAVQGTRLVVGAPREDTAGNNTGKVYIYDWNDATSTYDEVGTLTASDAQSQDYFGYSVALEGTRLAVGAHLEDTAGNAAGKVYIYEWNGATYAEVGTLTASDAEAWDNFGTGVALYGTRLVVGAVFEDTAADDAGKVYIYDWNGTTYEEVTTVTASDAEVNDLFGASVAVDGTRLVVGAEGAGKVYIYDWNDTSYDPTEPTPDSFEIQQITASDAEVDDEFGASVAVEGTRLVVGAHYESTAAEYAGKVYVYDWNGTSYDEVDTLTASDAEESDLFGASVALDGMRLIVGALFEGTAANNAGKVYVYEWNGTSYDEVTTLTASDAESYDQFGASVAVDGTRLVVGAPFESTAAAEAGKVYIYDWNGTSYVEVGTLTASNAQSYDGFGFSVALDGTRLAVGATGEDTAANNAGKVYIYEWNGTNYDEVATLTASDAEAGDQFGSSVTVDGTRLIVGAPWEGTAGEYAGKVYIYEWNGTSYVEVATLTASDAEAYDSFGMSVALDGTRLAVGAAYESTAGEYAGKVYIYDLDGNIDDPNDPQPEDPDPEEPTPDEEPEPASVAQVITTPLKNMNNPWGGTTYSGTGNPDSPLGSSSYYSPAWVFDNQPTATDYSTYVSNKRPHYGLRNWTNLEGTEALSWHGPSSRICNMWAMYRYGESDMSSLFPLAGSKVFHKGQELIDFSTIQDLNNAVTVEGAAIVHKESGRYLRTCLSNFMYAKEGFQSLRYLIADIPWTPEGLETENLAIDHAIDLGFFMYPITGMYFSASGSKAVMMFQLSETLRYTEGQGFVLTTDESNDFVEPPMVQNAPFDIITDIDGTRTYPKQSVVIGYEFEGEVEVPITIEFGEGEGTVTYRYFGGNFEDGSFSSVDSGFQMSGLKIRYGNDVLCDPGTDITGSYHRSRTQSGGWSHSKIESVQNEIGSSDMFIDARFGVVALRTLNSNITETLTTTESTYETFYNVFIGGQKVYSYKAESDITPVSSIIPEDDLQGPQPGWNKSTGELYGYLPGNVKLSTNDLSPFIPTLINTGTDQFKNILHASCAKTNQGVFAGFTFRSPDPDTLYETGHFVYVNGQTHPVRDLIKKDINDGYIFANISLY